MTETELFSIKEEFKKMGLNPDFALELEYKRVQLYLSILIQKTEKTLISIQEKEGLDEVSDRQKSVEKTLRQLIFSHNKCVQMEAMIFALKKENEMLHERLKLRK